MLRLNSGLGRRELLQVGSSPALGIRLGCVVLQLVIIGQLQSFDSMAVFAGGPPPADLATNPAGFKTIPGFQVELLYSVPMQVQGS